MWQTQFKVHNFWWTAILKTHGSCKLYVNRFNLSCAFKLDQTRALPILVFADIADIFLADMSTDIADTDIFFKIMVKKYLHYALLFFGLLA